MKWYMYIGKGFFMRVPRALRFGDIRTAQTAMIEALDRWLSTK